MIFTHNCLKTERMILSTRINFGSWSYLWGDHKGNYQEYVSMWISMWMWESFKETPCKNKYVVDS